MAPNPRPSTAPLFSPRDPYGLAEAGEDALIHNLSGTHEFLGDHANHHGDQSTVGPRGNTVQAGQLPRVSGPPIGAPDAINPAGRSSGSLVG